MEMKWLLGFLILSAAEIGLFIWTGELIGPWWVVILIIFTGFIGVSLAKKEGLETWRRAGRLLQDGHVPTKEISDGICIFVGGVLLLSPGFITDITGFVLVLPLTRKFVKPFLGILFKKIIEKNTIVIHRR
jgi:UPF0716 protein FxsA